MDLSAALYGAITRRTSITTLLGMYGAGPSVHTRPTVPEDAKYPLVKISRGLGGFDQDGLKGHTAVLFRSIAVYGHNPDHISEVTEVAQKIFFAFHRQKNAFVLDDYDVVDIVCRPPAPAPVSDDKTYGEMVGMTIRLHRKAEKSVYC